MRWIKDEVKNGNAEVVTDLLLHFYEIQISSSLLTIDVFRLIRECIARVLLVSLLFSMKRFWENFYQDITVSSKTVLPINS